MKRIKFQSLWTAGKCVNRYKTINLGRPTGEWKKLSGLAIATDNRLLT